MGFFRIMKSTSRNSLRLRFLLFIMIILFSTLCISITKYFFTDHLEIPPNGIEIQACGETQFHYQELSSSKRTLFSHNHRSLRYTIIGDVPKIRPPLFHDESEFCTDRISNQIKFMEEYASQLQTSGQLSQLPVITFLGMSGINSPSLGEIGPGSKKFAGCPIDRCQVTGNISQVDSADVLLWDNYPYYPPLRKPRNPAQIWLMHFFESPYSTPNLRSFRDQLNLTAGFRLDSDIPVPYDIYYPLEKPLSAASFAKRDWSSGKTGQVAWVVSNTYSVRNTRYQYALELAKHIRVDIFGKSTGRQCDGNCRDMSRKYKFYLSFENANCRQYITEKLGMNALDREAVPVVMGAHPADYARIAPPRSFLHVDWFESPAQLARVLHALDSDAALYARLHAWRQTHAHFDTRYWCRLCFMAHLMRRERLSVRYPDAFAWVHNYSNVTHSENLCIGSNRWLQRPLNESQLRAYLGLEAHQTLL